MKHLLELPACILGVLFFAIGTIFFFIGTAVMAVAWPFYRASRAIWPEPQK